MGLAATALPFADSPVAEAERWLRILLRHGYAGRALSELGLGEAPVAETILDGTEDHDTTSIDGDVITRVIERASHTASRRGAGTVGTTDVLLAVMQVYDDTFDRVLQGHGSTREALIERLQATGASSH